MDLGLLGEANYEGLVRNELASFWTPRLSHAFAQAPAEQRMPPSRRGSRPPRDELALKARRCTEQGFPMVRLPLTSASQRPPPGG